MLIKLVNQQIITEREWLSERLSFVKTMTETQGRFGYFLGRNKGRDKNKRVIFRGWYNNYIDVAIERFELKIGDSRR